MSENAFPPDPQTDPARRGARDGALIEKGYIDVAGTVRELPPIDRDELLMTDAMKARARRVLPAACFDTPPSPMCPECLFRTPNHHPACPLS
jgi:hypothetical protein